MFFKHKALILLHLCHPTDTNQPWTPALPTSAWMNPGETQNTMSTSHPACLSVTAKFLESGTASLAWLGMPCPPSASLRTTVAHMLPSGSMAATLSPMKASSPCLSVPASMTTAASGTPMWMWRPVLEDILCIACQDPQFASMFIVVVSEND